MCHFGVILISPAPVPSKEYLCKKDVLDKLSEGVTSGRHADVVAFACCLMAHLSNIVLALKVRHRPMSQNLSDLGGK